MNNENDISNQLDECIDNISPIIVQERLIDKLFDSQEELKQKISYVEELKKEKSLNWKIPILYLNGLSSVAIGILFGIAVGFGIVPSSITLPILGKVSTVLVSLIGINLFVSIGAIETISDNYRIFYSKLEEQEFNKRKLKIIKEKTKREQRYLEELKKQNENNIIETSTSNEIDRLKLLKDYLYKYVERGYVPSTRFFGKDIDACECEMDKMYPYSLSEQKQKEIEEVKSLLKK